MLHVVNTYTNIAFALLSTNNLKTISFSFPSCSSCRHFVFVVLLCLQFVEIDVHYLIQLPLFAEFWYVIVGYDGIALTACVFDTMLR